MRTREASNAYQAELFKLSALSGESDERDGSRISIKRIAAVVGNELALKLARDFGGTRLYLALDPDAESPLALSVGVQAARAIGKRFGGDEIEIPMFKSRAQRRRDREMILKLRGRHRSIAAIARMVGCSERSVYRILAGARML